MPPASASDPNLSCAEYDYVTTIQTLPATCKPSIGSPRQSKSQKHYIILTVVPSNTYYDPEVVEIGLRVQPILSATPCESCELALGITPSNLQKRPHQSREM